VRTDRTRYREAVCRVNAALGSCNLLNAPVPRHYNRRGEETI
jgi:hypothetical protein